MLIWHRCAIAIVLHLFSGVQPGYAQYAPHTLKGIVYSADSAALENATVHLLPSEETVITNANGEFVFDGLPNGQFQIRLTMAGFVTQTADVKLPQTHALIVYLQRRIVGLKEVSVIAGSKQLGSASVIDRSAILHTQPTSLADILQLVPGQLAVNPNLGSVNQVNLRQAGATTDASRANALGTQIVLDGVPLSNNANMQTDVNILNASPSASPPFSSAAGMGNDLRQIPADNIESIEVIRGIPSARYGDLTSGLIIVHSRIGSAPPEIRMRLNPNLTQASFVTGFSDRSFSKIKDKNSYNISTDILTAQNDVRDHFNHYSRLQAQLSWRRAWDPQKKFVSTTIVSGYNTLDKLKQDPDDLRYQSRHYANDYAVKASTEGKWRPALPWLTTIHYVAAFTYNRQQSYYQSLITRDLFPLSNAVKDTVQPGVYGKSEYLNQTTVDGRPMNGYARIEMMLSKKIRNQSHRFMLGSEWRLDMNKGAGRQFDPLTPPRQNYSMGDRPRSYAEIPPIHQLGYYLEDRMHTDIGKHRLILQAGIRLDNFVPIGAFKSKYKTILAPRVNIALETWNDIWIRGGYGVSAKTPTLSQLYPGTRYFDLVSFNYFAVQPEERLAILTTRTIDLDDQRIDPYTASKWEAGLDLEKKWLTIRLSVFHEATRGAIGYNRQLQIFTYNKLKIAEAPPGRPPILSREPLSVDTFFAPYDIPVNNRVVYNKGTEFDIIIPELVPFRTSFHITGAYIHTESFDNGTVTDTDRAYQSTTAPSRVGVYQTGNRVIGERFNTAVRLIHRIPQLNLVFSALWQTIWFTTNKPVALDPMPTAYINKKGENIALTKEQAALPENEALKRVVPDAVTTSYPPLHLLNIQFTREWRGGFQFSFRVNNFINHRPLHYNQASRGYVKRNEPLYFSAEFNVVLGSSNRHKIRQHQLFNN